MNVLLLQKPSEPLVTMYVAARTCYSPLTVEELLLDTRQRLADGTLTQEKMAQTVKGILDSGHQSVMEHVSYTFAIDLMPRIYTQQLTRHRIAVYSQQSQRYVIMEDCAEDVAENAPAIIIEDPELLTYYMEAVESSFRYYDGMIERLMAKAPANMTKKQAQDYKQICVDAARDLLVNCVPSNIVATMNLRQISHVCELRLCTRASEKMQAAFGKLTDLIIEDLPLMESYMIPQCEKLGYCPEPPLRSCGLAPLKKDVIG